MSRNQLQIDLANAAAVEDDTKEAKEAARLRTCEVFATAVEDVSHDLAAFVRAVAKKRDNLRSIRAMLREAASLGE